MHALFVCAYVHMTGYLYLTAAVVVVPVVLLDRGVVGYPQL